LIPTASSVATVHEPLISIAALPCSKASPVSAKIAGSGTTFSFQIRSWRNCSPPVAWGVSRTVVLPSGARMSPPFCQTSDDQ
jgi:hypothetical protein